MIKEIRNASFVASWTCPSAASRPCIPRASSPLSLVWFIIIISNINSMIINNANNISSSSSNSNSNSNSSSSSSSGS